MNRLADKAKNRTYNSLLMNGDTALFMECLRPGLAKACPTTVAQILSERWNLPQICRLLTHREASVRSIAAISLGLVGDLSCVKALAGLLHDADDQVAKLAENSLWAIWFRSGEPQAVAPFRDGLAFFHEERYKQAVNCFHEAVACDPNFAEAWHQCGIAHFFMGEYHQAIDASQQVIQIMPLHFAAISTIGHSYAQLDCFDKALLHYQWALRIHPRLQAIAKAAKQIKQKLVTAY